MNKQKHRVLYLYFLKKIKKFNFANFVNVLFNLASVPFWPWEAFFAEFSVCRIRWYEFLIAEILVKNNK